MSAAETPHEPVIPPPRFFFVVSIGAVVFFAGWSWLVHYSALPDFDRECADYWQQWSGANRRPLAFFIFLTDLGGIAAMTLLAIMGSIWQTAIKHKTLAVAWLGIVLGGAILNQGAKEMFDRKRPPNPEAVVHETNNSYPSGHAMSSAIGYGLLGYALVLPQRRRPRRIVAANFMIVIVIGVAFSRVYLRAHWFSDVVGGVALGVAWLFFCLGWLERRRRAHAAHTPA